MNRRSVLLGLLALPMASGGALAALPKNTEWVTTTNKLGLPVSYTKSLAADLWTIHGIECEKVLNNMCGTSFHIVRRSLGNRKNTQAFSLQTDDPRDGFVTWIDGDMKRKDMTNYVEMVLKWNHKWKHTLTEPLHPLKNVNKRHRTAVRL